MNLHALLRKLLVVSLLSLAGCAMEIPTFPDARSDAGDARGDASMDAVDARPDAVDALDAADARDALDAADSSDGGDGTEAGDAPDVADVPCVLCGSTCTDINTDIRNCGVCGNVCPSGINGSPACMGGRCGLSCLTGYGNCDGNLINGCETNTNINVMHCGACGSACPAGANGTPACSLGMCTLTCLTGYGNCDMMVANGCETDTRTTVLHCGACGRTCASGANSTATCAGSVCGITCDMGFGNCDLLTTNGCEADLNTNALNCGACARRCATAPNASAVCMAGACGITCLAGFANCDGNGINGCESAVNTDVFNCGSCGNVCPTRANSMPACAGGACGVRCNTGFADCNLMPADGCEVDTRTDNANCGTCGAACLAPPAGMSQCTAGACVVTCNPGYVLSGGVCIRAAPQPVAPASTAVATSRRPLFRVVLPSGQDGFSLEICADRACTSVATTSTVMGASGAATIDLMPGTYYWRVRGLIGGMVVSGYSAVWEFAVTAAGTPATTTSWGSVFDVNADRYADVIVGAPALNRIQVHMGGAGGVSTFSSSTPTGTTSAGTSVSSAADVNGDGYADAIVGAPTGNTAYVYHGNASTLTATAAVTLTGAAGSNFGNAVANAGDVDGDGFGDVVIGARLAARAFVHRGSATGVGATAAWTILAPAGATNFAVSVAGGCDLNGDGYHDVIIGADTSGTAYVYYGGSAGLATTPSATIPTPALAMGFGRSVNCAGDVNGDGYPDLVIGAYLSQTAYVFHGGSGGVGTSPASVLSVTGGALQFGWSVDAAGDVNRDGFGDVIVGAPTQNAAYVFHGAMTTGVGAMPVVTLTGSGSHGTAVSGTGDTNNDGYWDVTVGASGFPRAVVYRGTATGTSTTVLTSIAGTAGSQFGAAVASRETISISRREQLL